MKKAFYTLEKYPSLTLYKNYNGFRTSSRELEHVYLALNPIEDIGLRAYEIPKKGFFSIWTLDSFKEPIEIDFPNKAEQDAFEEAYDQYYDKRWYEMPHVKIALQDYEILKEKWKKIVKEKPPYIMFTLDDSGPLDKVDIVAKAELSEQDKQDIECEHQEYLKWELAKKEYIKDHVKRYGDYSEDVWRSPEDNEYNADIEKFYGKDPASDPEYPSYTKKEFALEIKRRIQEGQYPEVIGYWIARFCNIDADDAFLESTWEYENMLGKHYGKTLQDLNNFADQILAQEGVD